MKILFVVENYYPKMSGVPNVVKYLAEGLAQKGDKVTIVTRMINGTKENEKINNVDVVRKNIYYTKLKGFAGDTSEYIDFIINFDCDVIIFECSQCITTDLLLPYLQQIHKKKILHSHGFAGLTLSPFKVSGDLKKTLGNTFNWLKWKKYYALKFKKFVGDFDLTMCLSEVDSSRSYLETHSKKVYVLPNAADEMFFKNDISNSNLNKYINLNNEKYFISIANYHDYKNQIGILREFFKCKKDKFDMVFIGSEKNSYYHELVNQYNKLNKIYGYKPVHFLTKVDRLDIPGILQNASLYLVGSKFEEFSISLIEAMAMGVPFISTNVGNARVLPGGITIESIDEMSEVISSIIGNPKEYESYSKNGMKYSHENCKIENILKKLKDIMED